MGKSLKLKTMAKTQDEKLAAAKACFEFNLEATELFMTSDLECFFNKNNAANHASGLDERTLDHFTRSTDPVADPALVTSETAVTTVDDGMVTGEAETVQAEPAAVAADETTTPVQDETAVAGAEDAVKHIVEEIVDEVEKTLHIGNKKA